MITRDCVIMLFIFRAAFVEGVHPSPPKRRFESPSALITTSEIPELPGKMVWDGEFGFLQAFLNTRGMSEILPRIMGILENRNPFADNTLEVTCDQNRHANPKDKWRITECLNRLLRTSTIYCVKSRFKEEPMKILRFPMLIIILAFPLFLWPTFAEPANIATPNTETIRVSNETEFVNAIGSNRIIELNPGTYSLSKLNNLQTEHVTWQKVGDGYQMNINAVENLSINGLGDVPVKLYAEETHAFVLAFTDSNHVQLNNIEAGHFPEQGYCEGGVFYFGNCKNIRIENSVLFGCGKEGLTLSNVDNLQLNQSTIKDCSYGIMTAYNSTNLTFTGSRFHNNKEFDLFNFTRCAGISFIQCELFNNHAKSGYGFFNTHDSKAVIIKDCRIHDNSADHLLVAVEKETVKIANTVFQNNYFVAGGSICPIEDIFMWRRTANDSPRKEFYKRLEYLSRKVNDPEKLDKPKARKLFEEYWQKAVRDLNGLIKKQGSDWETESLLGKFYQIGLSIGVKDAWTQAETHLKNAIKLHPNLPRNNHLALGVLYASRHFTFTMGEMNRQSKLTISFKPSKPDHMATAARELAKDNGFPGTSNMYLFLIYYFQGKFEAAYLQANRYLKVFPDDELMLKLRGMAKKRIGNKQVPGELNVYIAREKTRRLFDFYFIQGSTGQPAPLSGLMNENNHSQSNLREFAGNGLDFKLGMTRKEIFQNIGTPVSVQTESVENRHQPKIMDTIYELDFDGLVVKIYDAGGKEIMLYQKISSPKYKVKYGLNIGESRRKIKDVLGDPQEVHHDKVIYAYYDEFGYETIVVFRIADDKIAAIEWNFPVD